MGDTATDRALNPAVAALHRHSLTWFPEAGVGYFECEGVEEVYDAAYFARYAAQAETETGERLNVFRAGLLRECARYVRHDPEGTILDVGIGDGAFLRKAAVMGCDALGPLKGFDVNPAGIAWLQERGQWGDLYARTWPAVTFWDALEHIREPGKALDQVERLAIVSIPIFRDAAHVLASRHYRRDEHYWYFTRAGFVAFAASCGFRVADILASETAIGREDIETFVLVRRGDGELA